MGISSSAFETYLSIDLDYWMDGVVREEDITGMLRFLRRVVDMRLPTVVVESHEELVGSVNRSGCRRLINLDYHSDLTDVNLDDRSTWYFPSEDKGLEEGNWVNFISWRREGSFLWIYPERNCNRNENGLDNHRGLGRCDAKVNPFGRHCVDVCGWGSCLKRLGMITEMELSQVSHLGISVSPDWIGGDALDLGVGYLFDRRVLNLCEYRDLLDKCWR